MQSFRENNVIPRLEPKLSLPIPVDLAVSMASAPLLLALVAGQAALDRVIQLGVESEELFRGDRLPLLPLLPVHSQVERE